MLPTFSRKSFRNGNDLENIWPNLEQGIVRIYELVHNFPCHHYMQLYTDVYNYCTSANLQTPSFDVLTSWSHFCSPPQLIDAHIVGQQLYIRLNIFLNNHVNNLLRNYNIVGEPLLQLYAKQWDEFKFSSTVLNGICSYLNQHWIKRVRSTDCYGIFEIYTLALVAWRNNLHKCLNAQIMGELLKLIEKERNGEAINRNLVGSLINSYVELGLGEDNEDFHCMYNNQNISVYQDCFEESFLKSTELYYTRESTEFLREKSVTEYMIHVDKRLEEEKIRMQMYLHQSTHDRLMGICERTLIEMHQEVYEMEFQNLLLFNRGSDLQRMYSHIARIRNGPARLKGKFEEHICNVATATVAMNCINFEASHHPTIYVQSIAAVHEKYNSLILTSLNCDDGFMKALDKACEEFINTKVHTTDGHLVNRSLELLAKHCDSVLKKSNKNHDESEVGGNLDRAMIVFKYIEDKDVFEKFYGRMLAQRLISHMSISYDAELSMITKLKQTCGYVYIMKFWKMLLDMNTSKNLDYDFKQYLQRLDITLNIDFSVDVLSSSAWPFKRTNNFLLPTELESSVNIFTKFYNTHHRGRKLHWLLHKSHGELATNCFKNTYAFKVNTLQMSILLQFNYQTEFTLQQLAKNTGIKCDILIQVLRIFLKLNILTSPDKEITAESVIKLSLDYTNKRLKVNLNIPLKQQLAIEEESVHQKNENERKFELQAVIVRIMKTRRRIKHADLLGEVFLQLSPRFVPSVSMIKKCIGTLIEKEYMERDHDQQNFYNYLA